MLIMGSKSGQLANRLFAFGHFIANAIEHGYTLINPTFDEYCRYFPATRDNDFGAHRIGVRLPGGLSFEGFRRLRRTILRLPIPRLVTVTHHETDRGFDLNDPGFLKLAEGRVVISDGWEFRDHRHFEKHAEVIRGFFRPTAELEDAAERVGAMCRQRGDAVVGVHVRKRDYREWQAGKYCFEDPIYLDKMLQIQGLLEQQGKRAVFLICSDEQLDPETFSSVTHLRGTGHFVEDLHALSNCDLLIGPPSSYSMWASFYGRVPLRHIRHANQRLSLEKFVIIDG